MTKKYFIMLVLISLLSCEKSQDNNDIILKFYGDVYEDIGYSIIKVDDGYIIAGQFTDVSRDASGIIDPSNAINNKKMAIIKTGTDGNVIWKKSFGDNLTAVGSKALVLDDGSIICTGYVTTDAVNFMNDIFVVKVDANGTTLMQKTYKYDGNQYGIDIIKTQEGYIILGSTDVAGTQLTESTSNVAGKKDILILRINNNLDPVVLPVGIGYPGNDLGIAIKADINGGYIILGTTDRSELGQAGNNIFLLRINSDGSVTEPKIIGGLDDEYATDIEVTSDGYIVPVTIGSDGTTQKGHILKIPANISSAPVVGSDFTFSTSASILSYSLKAISKYKTNSFVVAGQTGTGSSAKMLIFAVDADGNQIEGKEKIIGGTGAQVAYDVISDSDDYIIAVGKNSYENNSMMTLLKFRF